MTSYRRKTPGWRRVVLLGLLLPAACNPQQAAAPASRPAVGVRSAELRGVNQSFQFVGHIKAVSKVDLRARVEGFFEQVAFREGHAVRTGGILYQIEKVQFQAQLDQAKANLAAAEAVVTNAQLEADTDTGRP